MQFLVVFLMLIGLSVGSFGQSQSQLPASVTMPNFSVITTIQTDFPESEQSDFSVREVELAIQNYLHPSIKADIFLALHEHEEGEVDFELEEGYLTFLDFFDTIFEGYQPDFLNGFSARAGRKLLNFGRINAFHPEQLVFADRPAVYNEFLGGAHGAADNHGLFGDGIMFEYLLPLPFFTQLEVGLWEGNTDTHDHEGESEEEHAEHSETPVFDDGIFTTRIWTGFELDRTQELQIGASGLWSNGDAESDDTQASVLGIDATFDWETSVNSKLTLRSEILWADYRLIEDDEIEKIRRSGVYSYIAYKWNRKWLTGIRYDILENDGDTRDKYAWAFLISRNLSETNKLRLQYNATNTGEDLFTIQFQFGMGPHAHVLQ